MCMRFLLLSLILPLTLCCDVSFCQTCLGTQCVQCRPPYILTDGLCFGLPCLDEHCVACDYTHYYCVQCTSFYLLTSSGCRLSSYVVITPLVIFVMAMGICVFYCVVRMYKRRLQRRALQELERRQTAAIPALVATSDDVLDNPDFQFKYQESRSFCPICLQSQGNLVTLCGHYFHVECFSSWIRRHKICPTCNSTDMDLVIVVLCMRCKRKYHLYETFLNFLLQVKVDMDKPCKHCGHSGESRGQTSSKVLLEEDVAGSQQTIRYHNDD